MLTLLQYRHSSISWAHSARLIVEAHARAQSLMIRNDIHSNFIARGACTSLYTCRKPPTFSTLFFSLTRTATRQTCLPGSRRSWRDERARQVARLGSSLAEPRLLGRGEGLGNCLYVTCSRCSYSCKPIRLQDLKNVTLCA